MVEPRKLRTRDERCGRDALAEVLEIAHGLAAFAGSGSVSAFRIRSRMCHSRHRSPGAIFWRLVFGNVEFQLSTESERSALVDPVKRYAPKQQLDGQDARLPALDDGLYPVALAHCDAISS